MAALASASAAPAHAARENVAADSFRLNAQAAAVLARESSDARAAYAALLRHYSIDPERPGLRADVLRYAVLTGDRARATAVSEILWTNGSRSMEIRAILIAEATQRGDWKRVRELAGPATDKVRTAGSLLGDVIDGWVDVAQRGQNPGSRLRARTESRGSSAVMQAVMASILLTGGDVAGAAEIADRIDLNDDEARSTARRLVPQFAARGGAESAEALTARLDIVEPQSRDEAELARTAPGKITAAQGIAAWLGLVARGSDNPVGTNRRAALAFARSAVWLAPRDPQLRLVLANLLANEEQPGLALEALAMDAAAEPALIGLRRAELMVAAGEVDAGLALAAALAQRPDTTLDAQLRYLNLLRGQERTADAAVALDALLGLDDAEDKLSAPLFAQLLVARAEIHLANKNWDGAKPLLDQAVAIQGDNAAVLNFAGYSAIEARRDVDASFALIERALR
ncbi:MAG: hypothetical protein RLZZ58_1618, partial [Pseudomonadota bacterium]